ncbi:MAG: FHA domain-containing protein [bacterium]
MLVKVCPACGYHNKPNEILCVSCMSDIASVKIVDLSTVQQSETQEQTQEQERKTTKRDNILILKLQNSQETVKLKSGDIVGRKSVASEIISKIQDNKLVSRFHCQFIFKEGKWYVIDLDSTNNTFLNSQKLQPNKEYEIKVGDIISLAGVVDFVFESSTNAQ